MMRRRRLSINSILPSMFTLGSVCVGLTAVRHAIDHNVSFALGLILVAALLDACDGTVARWLKATSHFGGELDSLADFVAFGVSPALMVFYIVFDGQSDLLVSLAWAAALLFALCCCLRLARFNVVNLISSPDGQSDQKGEPFFRGVPAPMGGLLGLVPIALLQVAPELANSPAFAPCTIGWLVAIGLLMVSNIPTFALKKMRMPARHRVLFVLALMLVVLLAFEQPWLVWVGLGISYLGFIPFFVFGKARQ